MLRTFFLGLAALVLVVVAVFGWRGHRFSQPPVEIFPDMDRQPKVKPQTSSEFFADQRADRAPVDGTVPFGYDAPREWGEKSPNENLTFSNAGGDYSSTGRIGENWGAGFPLPVTDALMARGRERFGIYCAVCHGETGAGDGMAKQYGLVTVQSLLQDRIRSMPEGEIFHTITAGKNTMVGLGDRVPVNDRWAIILYLRALQRSQGGATAADVPPEEREKMSPP